MVVSGRVFPNSHETCSDKVLFLVETAPFRPSRFKCMLKYTIESPYQVGPYDRYRVITPKNGLIYKWVSRDITVITLLNFNSRDPPCIWGDKLIFSKSSVFPTMDVRNLQNVVAWKPSSLSSPCSSKPLCNLYLPIFSLGMRPTKN